MALTNFAALTSEQKTAWSKQFWKEARNLSFINQFTGTGPNSMVQRITELKKSEKGARAVLTLVNEMASDGVVGDYDLDGNEEALASSEDVIQLDQLRNANMIAGRMADQKSIVNFREQSKDKLAYWMADRMDQLAFLTLSGIAYTNTNKGAARPVLTTGRNLGDLEFASDVSAPTSARQLRWNGTSGGLVEGADTGNITTSDVISYKSLVLAKAFCKDNYIRGIRGPAGQEIYHVFVTPKTMAQLRLDSDFLANSRNALPRSEKNPLFAGATSVMIDGMIVHEFRHVYNTANAAGGSKWGAAGAVDGERVLICGAQALGFADIGDAYWEEEEKDYNNRQGISIGKIMGMKKPVLDSSANGSAQDFGVVAMDVAHV